VFHIGCARQSSCVLDMHLRSTWSPAQPRMVFHRVFDAVRIATPRALTPTACLIKALLLLRPARLWDPRVPWPCRQRERGRKGGRERGDTVGERERERENSAIHGQSEVIQ
jgi:hypothetical protein